MSGGSSTLTRPIIWLVICYIIELMGLTYSSHEEEYHILIPLNILITFGFLLYYQKHWNLRVIFFFIFSYIITFTIQAVAVNTGLIFGQFHYDWSLGLELYRTHTPLIIGLNWITLIYCTGLMVKNMKFSFWLQAALAASLLLMYDILQEPVAGRFHMWDWGRGNKVPIFNYLAWFAVSYPLLVLFLNLKAKLRNDLAPYIFLIQIVFLLFANLLLMTE